ncbi:MAG: hypothetical protein JSW24_00730, partial [Dehalococcoidia bacterium]
VPGVGLEPTRITPADFKFATTATELFNKFVASRRKTLIVLNIACCDCLTVRWWGGESDF